MERKPFQDRAEGGRYLAEQLRHYAHEKNLLVLGLPRGGVIVAYEVAKALDAPLDVFIVRKLGVPGQEELAMGAVASGGILNLNRDLMQALRLSDEDVKTTVQKEKHELTRREKLYREGKGPLFVHNKTVILVDDGLATGSTMLAAVIALRKMNPKKLVVAVPIASPETCAAFQNRADDVICAITPEIFYSVGSWYLDFSQITDEEVKKILKRSERGHTYEH